MTAYGINESTPLLRVKNLQTGFKIEGEYYNAVEGVSFDVMPKQIVGVVGESGCGKSVTAQTIMRLIPQPPGRIVGGRILFDGTDVWAVPQEERERLVF